MFGRFSRFRFSTAPTAAALVMFAVPASSEIRLAQDATFDGNWLTTIACSNFAEAKGYTWQFYSQVRHGTLQGQYGTPGRPSSVTLTGQIQSNGAAMLVARGLSGDPDYTVGHVAQASPFFYHIAAQFQGAHGSGKRQETRPCDVTFVRQ